jgi:hypothetical protein
MYPRLEFIVSISVADPDDIFRIQIWILTDINFTNFLLDNFLTEICSNKFFFIIKQNIEPYSCRLQRPTKIKIS